MADRTSAEIFGSIFEMLSENPDERNKGIAKRIWSMIDAYDFNAYQMYVDDSLKMLELAREVRDEESGDDEVATLQYGPIG